MLSWLSSAGGGIGYAELLDGSLAEWLFRSSLSLAGFSSWGRKVSCQTDRQMVGHHRRLERPGGVTAVEQQCYVNVLDDKGQPG